MATGQISKVIQRLRSTVLVHDGVELSDGNLLECFLQNREPAALETLVRRHGPMVWGVCRRILRNHHDAEDAFQAAFLVLVRRASSIKPLDMVGNWLYGVSRIRPRSRPRDQRQTANARKTGTRHGRARCP